MEKRLRGIALIVFGVLLMLLAILDPWIPGVADLLTPVFGVCGVCCGIVGLIIALKK